MFKHLINRQVESPYRMRQDAIKRREAAAEDEADGVEAPKTFGGASSYGGSVAATGGKKGEKGGDDPTRYVP